MPAVTAVTLPSNVTAVSASHVSYKEYKSSIYVFLELILSTHYVHVPPHICYILICHITIGQ